MGEVGVTEPELKASLVEDDVREATRNTPALRNYWGACWPGAEDIVGDRIALTAIAPNVIEEAATAIRHVLRPHVVPKDLESRFLALRVRQPRIRPSVADTLLARYRLGKWRIQIQERNHFVDVVCHPEDAITGMSPESYVCRIAHELLRIPKGAADHMLVSRVSIGRTADGQLSSTSTAAGRKIWYGLLRYEGRTEAWHSRSPDRPKDAWLGQIWTMTNGRWVHFAIRETHRKPGPLQARPRPVPRFPQPRGGGRGSGLLLVTHGGLVRRFG